MYMYKKLILYIANSIPAIEIQWSDRVTVLEAIQV